MGDLAAARAAIREAFESDDMDALTRLLREHAAPDFVQEWPQSGERVRGTDNARRLFEMYEGATGARPTFRRRRMLDAGDVSVVEGTIDYGDGVPVSYVGIIEFADGKATRATEYFANPFEAPAWRADFVERMEPATA